MSKEKKEDKIMDAEVVPVTPGIEPGKEPAVKPEGALEIPKRQAYAVALEGQLRCDKCFLSEACAFWKAGAECSLGITADINGSKDVLDFSKKMLSIAAERVLRAYHFEKVNGGVISPEVDQAMKQFMDLTQWVKDIGDNRDEVTIRAKGSGIISQLFGNMGTGGKH